MKTHEEIDQRSLALALERDWTAIREVLVSNDETGRRLRQSSPFCGILSPVERWQLYRE